MLVSSSEVFPHICSLSSSTIRSDTHFDAINTKISSTGPLKYRNLKQILKGINYILLTYAL